MLMSMMMLNLMPMMMYVAADADTCDDAGNDNVVNDTNDDKDRLWQ